MHNPALSPVPYRVWCHPERGAPDEFEGEDYFYAFATYDEALTFSHATVGTEKPLVLIRQNEWINEPQPGQFIHEKCERIAEWRVEWLPDSKRTPGSIEDLSRIERMANNRVNSDVQEQRRFALPPLDAGYAGRYISQKKLRWPSCQKEFGVQQ
ncbi:hypothetical protein LZ639_19380 [Pseudomonas stutzeri]|jgi:hypothetical protein|uniref:Putative GCN5-related N-acetyltransferase n=1 Tax=Stutzerimonas stutzeri TaxID=316 RepID=B3SPW1_STUST|nr:hypothetical protein [Stutzerimonas stutzeri]ABV54365.1 putative GCN5-related N-acetyltransferase [Stutzerimonas stutzeri]AZL50098.1 hypothetical protein CXB48_21635 [Stutzerimonas stutzeri]MBS9726351.1 hypothetical protein [Stutzerimonas stutzeri]MCF0017486.1 hypothetical protein [Stutzerimonas stutzeri]MCF0019109.1 hypothetical protein [Stutzerimonas stutzeri]